MLTCFQSITYTTLTNGPVEEALARCFGWTEEVLLAKPLLALRDFGLADGGANVQARARGASNGGWDVEMVHATITSHFRGTLSSEKANLLSIKHLHGTDQWP